jgi:hypothetical protein
MPIRFTINTRSDVVARSHDAYALAAGERRRKGALFVAALALALLGSAWMGEVDPARLLRDFHKFPAYLGSIVPTLRWDSLGADFAEWYWGIGRWSGLLLETLMIAYVGTVLGFIGGFILCFPASSNLVRSRWVVFLARRTLEIQRTVPEIVFALIFVVAFGLGLLAGVLAIAIHTPVPSASCSPRSTRTSISGRSRGCRRQAAAGSRRCGSPSCRRSPRTSPAMRCCGSRSMSGGHRSSASWAPAASARNCSRPSASSTIPTSARCC